MPEELRRTEATTTRPRAVLEHFGPDSFRGTRKLGTHSIVLANDALLEAGDLTLLLALHSEYRWLSVPELLASPEDHPCTQGCFRGDSSG